MEYNIAKIKDKIRSYEKNGNETSTYFLTPAQVQEAIFVLRGYDYTLSGGFSEAERKIIIIGNKEANIGKYLSIIRVQSFQKELHHPNVLGSVLGLGIKREMIGDIIVKDKCCDIIIIREMKEYILNNLHMIGSEKVEAREVNLKEILSIDAQKKVRNISVASLRLDAVISVAFGISREKSNSLVSQEKILINFLPCTNNSKTIKAGDLISARGFRKNKNS
ncbi:MAG: RNA-binding protein [Clostridia bacterium]|nr:RNA-binding protein [Clostridia bacterium]